MHNRSFGARLLASPILPTGDDASEFLPDELTAEITEDPAFREIAKALACARYLGMDLQDPAVADQCVGAGRRHFALGDFAIGYPHRRRPSRGLHDPVVYYAAMDDLVKIGTSVNILTRMEVLGQPRILALEWGGETEEGARHKFFVGLRVHGEWFRNQDPLTSYVSAVAASFARDFRSPSIEDWIWELKMQSRRP